VLVGAAYTDPTGEINIPIDAGVTGKFKLITGVATINYLRVANRIA